MSGREEILARIREALQGSKALAGRVSFPDAGKVLAPIPPGELVERFEEELKAVAGCCHRARSKPDLEKILREILPASGGASVVFSRNPIFDRLPVLQILEHMNCSVARWPGAGEVEEDAREMFRKSCFSATAGITGVDFALAESGTLVLSSAAEGTQLASLAPSIHIAFYTRPQVVESLEEVLEQVFPARTVKEEKDGRSVVFVTGVSRTSDIEQVSIRGVHGPTSLHAILAEDACFD
ncbi:MAG: lactate utilization protein [Acidobacteriota bacterium]|nr:lactate utilization protein [Acidobacteriota bacterium]